MLAYTTHKPSFQKNNFPCYNESMTKDEYLELLSSAGIAVESANAQVLAQFTGGSALGGVFKVTDKGFFVCYKEGNETTFFESNEYPTEYLSFLASKGKLAATSEDSTPIDAKLVGEVIELQQNGTRLADAIATVTAKSVEESKP